MENNDNTQESSKNNTETPDSNTKKDSCCWSSSYESNDGSCAKKYLLWAIAGVLVIGAIGFVSSKSSHKKQEIVKARQQNEMAALNQRVQMMESLKAKQKAHAAAEKAKQEALEEKASKVSNPELNFRLEGYSHVRVLVKEGEIYYIDINQTDGDKGKCGEEKKDECYPKSRQQGPGSCPPKQQGPWQKGCNPDKPKGDNKGQGGKWMDKKCDPQTKAMGPTTQIPAPQCPRQQQPSIQVQP
jgi:hypothetical protein